MKIKEAKKIKVYEEAFADMLKKRGVKFEREYHFKKFYVEHFLEGIKQKNSRFDFALPKHKIAFEVDGGLWKKGGGAHNRPQGYINDRYRDFVAMAYGWKVYRIPSDWLKDKTASYEFGIFLDDIFKL